MHPTVVYFLGAIILWFFREKKVKNFFLLFVPLLVFLQVIFLKPQTAYFIHIFDFPVLLFYVDRLNLFFGYIFSLVAFFVVLYSFRVKENIYFSLAFFYIGSSLGAVFSGEYLTFFIFLELMAISSTFLIWLGFTKTREETLKAGFRYLLFHVFAGVCLFAGILIEYLNAYFATGKFGLNLLTTPTTKLSFAFILLGIGINACFIPFHTWLPDAYPRTSFYVSVLLSIFTTKTAVYALARIFPGVNFLTYIGALMAIYGVTFAIIQNEMRKLLSYHIISQVGYMVAAIGLGGDLGINGGLFHALNNILYKTLLFMCAGAVIYRLSEEKLSNLGHLSEKMPITTFTVLIGAFSIAGVPLFNGHISKIIISESAHGNETIYFLLKIATIGTWLSFLKFIYFGFLRKTMQTDLHGFKQMKISFPRIKYSNPHPYLEAELPLTMLIPMVILAFFCFFTGVYPKLVIQILPYPLKEIIFYSLKNITSAMQVYLVGLLIFTLLNTYFVPGKVIFLDLDYYYRKVVASFLCLCRKVIAPLDVAYTSSLEKLIPYAKETWMVSKEEGNVEKIIVNGSGLIVRTSERVAFFDQNVIDGTVNHLGKIIVLWAKKLRHIQTGYLQNYATVMFFFLIVLIFFLVIF
jgi:multicomponent Na+:H+ antiporter subunit D